MNIYEMFSICGGLKKVAAACKLKPESVFRWSYRQIPVEHWDNIIKLSSDKITPEDLHKICKEVSNACGKDRRSTKNH